MLGKLCLDSWQLPGIHDAQGDGMLILILATVKTILVRPVITVFGPEDQSFGYPEFRGKGDFLSC
jgi:hypothetical protein